VPDCLEIADSWIFEPTKESKEPMKEPRDYVLRVNYDDEIPPMVDSNYEIPPFFIRRKIKRNTPMVDSDEIPPMEKPINEALKNIDNLIHIRKSERLRVALADWERGEQAYRKRVHRRKKVLRNTGHEVITLTGSFLALQGLLLTAAAVSSSSQCTNLSFLLAVSGLVTFCALAFVWHKEVTMRRLQRVIVLEKAAQKVLFDMLCGSNAKEPLLEILCTADFLIAALL